MERFPVLNHIMTLLTQEEPWFVATDASVKTQEACQVDGVSVEHWPK